MMEAACQHLAKTLGDYLRLVAAGLINLPAAVDKGELAYVLIGRLLLIYDLQVGGFLGQGDRWYLHTRLSQHSANAGSFFKTFLQPLCHQGLALPPQERSRSLRQTIGDVPYLGGRCFLPQPLEQQYPDLDIADEIIEQFLGWLAEQPWQRQVTPAAATGESLNRTVLAGAWEWLLTEQTGKATVSELAALDTIAQVTIDAHLLRAIARQPSAPSLTALLSELTDPICTELITTVLPQLTILDPACGSGRLLLLALERLQTVYRACWQHAQQSSDQGLQGWVRSLQSSPAPPWWTVTRQILTQNLYGVDLLPEAVTVTQLQLWLRLLSTVEAPAELPPLPDLDFNITRGNALLGFIRVDVESFDQVAPKRLPTQAPRSPASETILQGNLLQPLAAASYRDTLTEKKIRVEHYQAQTKAMGSEGGMPEYAQTEFLRDRIETVNQSVQHKLDTLLFETFSRKLGIQIKEPSGAGRTRKRLLTLADIEALQPFHWGFFFNPIVEQQGGFDVVLTHAPDGNLTPTADEFYRQHPALFQQLGIEQAQFRRSRRQILQQFPAIARLWSAYARQINAVKDYVRRGDDYPLPVTLTARRSISLKSLFSQRCAALAKADSVPPHIT